MNKVRVALIQMNISTGNWEENVSRAESFLEQASNVQAQICLLPEMWSTGLALGGKFYSLAEGYFQKTLDLMRSWAKKYRLFLVAGSIPETTEGRLYNTSFFISPAGEVLGFYRKRELFPLFREGKYFSPGREIKVFKTPWGKAGIVICYELRFPEGFQQLRKLGARMVFVPAQFPLPRENHWTTLLKSRAIENQYYVVACNRVGKDAQGLSYFGGSMIVDPWGDVLIQARDDEAVLALELDLSLVEKIRKEFPVLKD